MANKIIESGYIPQPKQRLMHECRANEILYGGSAGPGKVVLNQAVVLTPFGWKKGKDLEVGTTLCNPDGSHQKIIAISEEMTHPGWTVSFHDGSKTIVMEGHLWKAWRSRRSVKKDGKRISGEDSAKIITTKTLSEWHKKALLRKSGAHNWVLIPVCEEQNFNVIYKRKSSIDPYLLGLLLGDGYIGSKGRNGVSLASSIYDYEEILENLKGLDYSVYKKKNSNGVSILFRGETSQWLKKELEFLNLLGTKSGNKFIPHQCLFDSIENRYALLQGLMDTDGMAGKDSDMSYCSISKQLAKDVKHLISSLGGTAVISEKEPFYRDNNGNKVYCNIAYNLYIKHRKPKELFRLKRKKDRVRLIPITPLYKRVVDVEIGEEVSGRCITVDNPNGLYITDDFIVTHNSHALRYEGLDWAMRVPGLQVYLFRRTFPELEKNHILSSLAEFPKDIGKYKVKDHRWELISGSMLHFCHAQHENDIFQYQGAEIHLLLIDELTTFTEFMYDYLRGRVRCTLDIPQEYKNKIPGIVCATNPGGVGHEFCKRRWVDFAEPFELKEASKKEGGMTRCYIPGLIEDNKILTDADPLYIHRLDALPEPYRTAYLFGDWEIFFGQMFNFNEQDHVIDPRPVPEYSQIYFTLDPGFGAPFSCLWFWIDQDERLFLFSELYGWNGLENQGLRLSDSEVADMIVEHEKTLGLGDRNITRLCDPTSFNKKPDYKGGGQGKSTADEFQEKGLDLYPGDASRLLKIRQFHERLRTYEDQAPMLQVYSNCKQFIRTIPLLQADPRNPEDINSRSEDHCVDDKTEILTNQGWKLFEDLNRTETVATLSKDGI